MDTLKVSDLERKILEFRTKVLDADNAPVQFILVDHIPEDPHSLKTGWKFKAQAILGERKPDGTGMISFLLLEPELVKVLRGMAGHN